MILKRWFICVGENARIELLLRKHLLVLKELKKMETGK